MEFPRRRVRQLAAWLLSGALAAGTVHASDLAGRRVGDVLDELKAQGLSFIYNTQIVPPTLLVGKEPRARRGLELATEILGSHGLTVSQIAPDVYAIVAAAAEAPRPRPSPITPVDAAVPPLEEIVVQTSRYALAADKAASHTFLTQDQVENMPRLADETLRAVQRLPGVTTNGFSSLASVRGGEPNETAIVLDGLRLYEPFHLKNFLSPVSLLDSRLIEGLDVYSGGFAAIYGDRMSAVVDATSVRPRQPRYYEAGLSLFHASVLAASEFAAGRGQVLVSARRSNLGDLAQFSEEEFGEPQYSDGFVRLDYRLGEAARASLDVLISSDQIQALKDSGKQRAQAEYRNAYTWATLDYDWSQSVNSRLIASFTKVDNDRYGSIDDPGRRRGSVDDRRFFNVIGLRLDNTVVAAGMTHRFGTEVRRLRAEYAYSNEVHFEPDFPFPGSPGVDTRRSAAPRPHGYETAAFWDGRTALSSRWTVQAGMRVDTQTYDGSGDSAQWSPRLSLLYQLGPRTRLRSSWGRFFQSQAINELQVEDGIDSFHQAQHADHLILSFEHELAAGLDLRVEGYRKYYRRINPRFENLFDPLVLLPELEFDRVMIDPGSARAAGVELLLNVRPASAWSGWFNYTWSRVRDHVQGREVPRSWDQTHAVNFGITWSKGPWTATLINSYHTGWPTTALYLGGTSAAPQINIGMRNSRRFAHYDSLDLRATRTFQLSHGALDVFAEVSNAVSRRNPCCVEYSLRRHPDGSVFLEQDIDSWLPLVPSFGVLWRY